MKRKHTWRIKNTPKNKYRFRKALLEDGKTVAQLVQELKCQRFSVTRLLKEYLSPEEYGRFVHKRRKFSPEEKTQLVKEAFSRGENIVAKQYEIHLNVLRRWILEARTVAKPL